eukprot:578694-Pleurochrysis_carterae.AAC.1
MENGRHTRMPNEDIRHMNGADGKKLMHKALQVATHVHERHDFHLAVATDGAKRGRQRIGWNHRRCRRPLMGHG